MNDQIQDMLDKVGPSARSSKYMDRLEAGSKEVLELFATWLVTDDDKAVSTAGAYKGYVAQALCHIEDGGELSDLSTDVRSAINALRRFKESGVADISEEPAELEG